MDNNRMGFKRYTQLPMPYKFDALEPHISKEIMEPHYSMNHKAYVDNANKFIERYEKVIAGEVKDYDIQGILRAITFNVNGHKLHARFWNNMAGEGKGGGKPGGKVGDLITSHYGSFDRFKQIFTEAANSMLGAGWTALCYDKETGNPQIMTIENHFMNKVAGAPVLALIDEWEHAFNMQYKTKRADYVAAWWNVVNWDDAEKVLEMVQG